MSGKKKVGWIGLGKMGLPMAHNLARVGYEIRAYNRSTEKSEGLAAEYGQVSVADSPAAAADGADVVISITSDDRVLEAVTSGPGGIVETARPGMTFVDMSTVSPMVSERVAKVLGDQEIGFLRAPVVGSLPVAERGELKVLSSGPKKVLEDVRDVIEPMAGEILWVGEAEQSRYLKLAINLQLGIAAGVFTEALAFGRKGGMDHKQMIDVLADSPAASPLIKFKAEPLKNYDFTPAFSMEQMAKDLDLALATAREMEAPMQYTAMIRQQISAMIARGEGAIDWFGLILLAEEMAGIESAKE
jgi:3-hydroxyisobutyrate dehydrogenase-like beta-hydroxyacid dehydrogenase